ncbi:hypothetical protein KAFR_0B06790 [Kazachstania africana CBS 2517]|uniref:Uncharacterized protein n=1 Tax=Kazachstania africana (strain ATCC 22294 / BCRC 22015 / CBS 2517 / CECT 1963 / NBRC 1671 / NRRL Y-8276) TaxID=1071382 RepID=H2ARH6_KAZAF|nr:hypothetical protein KAFR_0B06790 [Kazachstania africana CBS 2517]CCF56976.1 hypothetical protein KAFR_0B06790 [Kazachstania africana CBS 2517]
MSEIVYSQKESSFANLRIAGDFTNWEIKSMEKRSDGDVDTDTWVYPIEESFLKSKSHDDKQKIPICFKFIDDNGNWFTVDAFEKDRDEHNNVNNVKTIDLDEIAEESIKKHLEETIPSPQIKHISENQENNSFARNMSTEAPITPVPSLKEEFRKNFDSKSEEKINEDDLDHDLTAFDPVIDNDITTQLNIPAPGSIHSGTEATEGSDSDHENMIFYSPMGLKKQYGTSNTILSPKAMSLNNNSPNKSNNHSFSSRESSIIVNDEEMNIQVPQGNDVTAVANTNNYEPEHYKTLLERILGIFSGIFTSWFGLFASNAEENETS